MDTFEKHSGQVKHVLNEWERGYKDKSWIEIAGKLLEKLVGKGTTFMLDSQNTAQFDTMTSNYNYRINMATYRLYSNMFSKQYNGQSAFDLLFQQ